MLRIDRRQNKLPVRFVMQTNHLELENNGIWHSSSTVPLFQDFGMSRCGFTVIRLKIILVLFENLKVGTIK